MTPETALLLAGTGLVAGACNTVAGGGSLLSFPVLIGTGLNPLAANVTNTIGLVVGAVGGGFGYRREMARQRHRLVTLSPSVVVGAIAGAVLLLRLPAGVFSHVVPVLIAIACLLLLAQPRLATRFAAGHAQTGGGDTPTSLRLAMVPISAYGSYFGAGLGIMTLAVTGVMIRERLAELNALKLGFGALTNGIAAVIFALVAPVAWADAGVLAVSSTVGALAISPVARRLPATPLRWAIAAVGLGVAAWLAVRG